MIDTILPGFAALDLGATKIFAATAETPVKSFGTFTTRAARALRLAQGKQSPLRRAGGDRRLLDSRPRPAPSRGLAILSLQFLQDQKPFLRLPVAIREQRSFLVGKIEDSPCEFPAFAPIQIRQCADDLPEAHREILHFRKQARD